MKPFLHLLALVSVFLISEHTHLRESHSASENDSAPRVPGFNPRETIKTNLADYLWPTDAGHIITSSFAEFRSSHFHAGIDISTGDVTGYKVFASRDGYVSRVRVSPVGYGKMLYVRHSDGYTTTYAHLGTFSPLINARVAREQQRLERFAVGFDCAPGEFPVHKGDVIAYTGDTGSGSAHLHFEIRDEYLNPINPLLCANLHTPDSLPPIMRKIAVTPIGPGSLVNGEERAQIYQTRQITPRHYHIIGPVAVTGEAGIAVDVLDHSDGTRYKHGVYSLELSLDGRLIFSVELDRIPYHESQQIGLYYDWSLLDARRGRFERLYAALPNGLPFYRPNSDGAGIINSYALPDGPHAFKIVSEDYSGNTSELTGELIISHPPQFMFERDGTNLKLTFADPARASRILIGTRREKSTSWQTSFLKAELNADVRSILVPIPSRSCDIVRIAAENAQGIFSPPQFFFVNKPRSGASSMSVEYDVESDFVRVTVRTPGVFTSPPTAVVFEGSRRREIEMTARDVNCFVGAFNPLGSFSGTRRIVAQGDVNGKPAEARDECELYAVTPGEQGSIVLDGGNLTLAYDSLSVYGPTFFQIKKDSSQDGISYSLSPRNTILREGFLATVRTGAVRTHGGLFFRGRVGWELIGKPESDSAMSFQGRISRTLGELAVLIDDIPPLVGRLAVAGVAGRRPTISFRYGDNLSGIEYNELKTYIDGRAVIPEIDGEHHRAFYKASDPLEHGSHLLSIRLKDKLGNASIVERRFTIR